jgi:hypothetical protein
MTEDPYAPPVARVDDVMERQPGEFYVVAPRKFLLLYVFTVGIYSIYWFYENWTLYKRFNRQKLWPVPRSIFQIFFTHSLFRAIDQRLRRTGRRHEWDAEMLATAYVGLQIGNWIIDRVLPDDLSLSILLVVLVASLLLTASPLLSAQRAANRAEGDSAGASNSALTAANIAWIILGGLFWLMMLLGVYASLTEMPV